LKTRPELLRYLKHGHRFVKGWLLPGAIKMLVALAKAQDAERIKGNVAEIGVHHGKLLILLALLTRDGEKAVAVDLFADQDRNVDHSGKGDLDQFQENTRRHADCSHIVMRQGDSTELTSAALMELGGGAFRLISVDGGHTPEITVHDLSTAEGALAPGGIIILDDCFNEKWPGVSEGLFRYFSDAQPTIVPFATGGNKTLFCTPEYAGQYIEALRSVPARVTAHGFLGCEVICCDFRPLPIHEHFCQNAVWRSLRGFGAVKVARGAYHYARGVLGH
jgi:hypothetical protein